MAVLIIGNGFDLDLGFKTSYRDFCDSSFFEKIKTKAGVGLLAQISNNFTIKKWIDLEIELKQFSLQHRNRNQEFCRKLKSEYESLSGALCEYLGSLPYNEYTSSSFAYQLLKILCKSTQLEIFNFNYTPFDDIFAKLLEGYNCKLTYVHGRVRNNDIIVGIEDEANVMDEHCFLIKSHNENYNSVNLRQTLLKADNVIFFGHSLGSTDYHYFSDFFLLQSGVDKTRDFTKKSITIFTLNESSRGEILLRLRNMNNKSTNCLYDNNDLKIFCTGKEKDKSKIDDYLKEIEKGNEIILD